MKTILNLAGGAVLLTESAGVFTLSIKEVASVGGGAAAGVVQASGSGSIVLNAGTALKLGEALLNAHLPVSVQPLAAVVEAVANQAISALE